MRISLERVVTRLGHFAPALRAMKGGLTISGGEPLVQAAFSRRILGAAKSLGLHTAIETSGFLGARATDEYLQNLDLVILDIKSGDPETYRRVTRQELAPTLRFAERLAAMGKPVWVRYTLVPGLTDDPANVEGVAKFVAPMKNVEWVEVLPFHQLGAFKWKALGMDYTLADTPPAPPELVARVHRPVPRRGLQRALEQAARGKQHGNDPELARAAAADGAVPDDRHRLPRRGDQHQGLLPRRRRGALRRARHGLVRAEVGAGADGRNARPRALPLRRGRPIRQAVLHRTDQPRRHQGEPDRADRRAGGRRGEPPVREDDGPQSRLRAGAVRRFGNQHADAAGGHRDARQRRSRRRLFGLLSVRRGRADPVPLHRVHGPEAEDRGADGHAASKCSKSRCAIRNSSARRSAS